MFDNQELHEDLRETAKSAAERIIAVTVKKDEEDEIFRPEYIQALGEEGLCGIPTSEEFGGMGMGYLEYSIILEELGKVSASYAISIADAKPKASAPP